LFGLFFALVPPPVPLAILLIRSCPFFLPLSGLLELFLFLFFFFFFFFFFFRCFWPRRFPVFLSAEDLGVLDGWPPVIPDWPTSLQRLIVGVGPFPLVFGPAALLLFPTFAFEVLFFACLVLSRDPLFFFLAYVVA